jgi:hypothetical protein
MNPAWPQGIDPSAAALHEGSEREKIPDNKKISAVQKIVLYRGGDTFDMREAECLAILHSCS